MLGSVSTHSNRATIRYASGSELVYLRRPGPGRRAAVGVDRMSGMSFARLTEFPGNMLWGAQARKHSFIISFISGGRRRLGHFAGQSRPGDDAGRWQGIDSPRLAACSNLARSRRPVAACEETLAQLRAIE